MNARANSTLGNLSGLAALTKQVTNPVREIPDMMLPVEKIVAKSQIRKTFKDLEELAASIKVDGLLQPIIVAAMPDGSYTLIAGERRLRAAKLAGLAEIPVKIKRGVDDLQMRRMQIAENLERDDLTVAEEAAAVIEDMEKYGLEQTMALWNRSKAWVSKRNSTRNYRDIARAALDNGYTDDLELLSALNQLEALDAKGAGLILGRLKEGLGVAREDVRNSVLRAKNWAEAQKNHQADASAETSENLDAGVAGDDQAPRQGATEQVEDQETESPVGRGQAGDTSRQTRQRPPAGHNANKAEANIALNSIRERIYKDGRSKASVLEKLPAQLHAAGLPQIDGEWVLWSAFLDSVLPVLDSIGPERAVPYLKRLMADIKGKAAADLWAQLHDDQGAVPAKPENWHF